nr:hypothetical protein [Tanacetum cinerariifolium]
MVRDDNHDGDHPETFNTSPPVPPPTSQIPNTVSSIKLPIIKKGKYDIWAKKMEHYLSHIDYPIWQGLHKGYDRFQTLLSQLKIHGAGVSHEDTNQKFLRSLPSSWSQVALIMRTKPRLDTLSFDDLYNNLKVFKRDVSYHPLQAEEDPFQGTHKWFQTLMSHLEIHGAGVSHEVTNQKFLRSLPSSWSRVALIMRTKPGLDTLSFDDLYNNLRVFKRNVKGTTASSSSNTHNRTLNKKITMTGDDNLDGDQPKTSNPLQPITPPTSQLPHTVLSIKLPILKKGEYDIWVMNIEHYLCHTNYLIWQVIQNGNSPDSVITDTNGMIKVLPPKSAEGVVGRERERKARTTLLMALPEDHLAIFHKMDDGKEICEAIKSIFGLHKGYDRFQTLLSHLEIHGAGVSHEDTNQKFLRSLPSSWSQVALIMRTKPRLDTLSFDDLYNNLKEGSSSYTDEVIYSFLENQSSAPQLDYDDLEQINDDDIEEMDLKWQVAMISIRIKKFHKRIGRKLQFDTKDPVGFDKTKDDSKALVTINGEDIDWLRHVEEDSQNCAMMAYSSSNSGSDNEVKSCSKAYEESYARLKKLYDEQKDKLGDACVEITAYTLALNKTSVDELDSKPSEYASCESNSSVDITTSMPEPVENAPKVVCEPKVWTNAPIIKEHESDSDNDSVFNVQEDKEKPNFAFTDSV